MKKVILYGFIFTQLVACGTVQFNIKDQPPNLTKEQVQIDDLQCSKQSERNGPWLYGIGTLIYRSMAKNAYQECMTQKGYTVEPK